MLSLDPLLQNSTWDIEKTVVSRLSLWSTLAAGGTVGSHQGLYGHHPAGQTDTSLSMAWESPPLTKPSDIEQLMLFNAHTADAKIKALQRAFGGEWTDTIASETKAESNFVRLGTIVTRQVEAVPPYLFAQLKASR